MKVNIEIDCTPLEARQFFGLPDVSPLQAAVMDKLQQQMTANLEKISPEALMQSWLTFDPKLAERFQDMFVSMAGLGAPRGSDNKTQSRRPTGRAEGREKRRRFAMIELPPPQFAPTNGIRMGYYEAGPGTDQPPLVLCHGWPEIAFSWRHQIKALGEAGIRVIAPDQRGYGATDRPEPVEDYDIEHLTGDLVGLLDHLKIDKAVFVGHDWGGFVVWQMALRHPDRVAGVVGINTPHLDRAPADPIELLRKRFGDAMYIVQFQDPARGPDKIFDSRVEQTFDAFMRKPVARPDPVERPVAGIGASPRLNLAFPQMIANYDARHDPRTPILSPEEKRVFVDTFARTGFTGGINWYRNMSRNWQRSAGLDHTVRVPSLMIMAENDAVLPPSSADGMEKIVPDLEKYLVRDSGHWTQQEKPEEVSAKLIEWRRRRFG